MSVINTSLKVKLKQISPPRSHSIQSCQNIKYLTKYLNKYFNKYPKPIASPRIQISLNQISLFILWQRSKFQDGSQLWREKNSPASVKSLNSILNSKSNFVVCTCGQIFSDSKSDFPPEKFAFWKMYLKIKQNNQILKRGKFDRQMFFWMTLKKPTNFQFSLKPIY